MFLLFIVIFSPKLLESKNKLIRIFIKVINSWHLIKNSKKIISTAVLVTFIQLILGAVNTLISYNIFGIEIGFLKVLFIATISHLALPLSITPGNLGVRDVINVFSANIVGIGLTEVVAATILKRAITILIIFILGPIFSYILIRYKPQKNKNNNHMKNISFI